MREQIVAGEGAEVGDSVRKFLEGDADGEARIISGCGCAEGSEGAHGIAAVGDPVDETLLLEPAQGICGGRCRGAEGCTGFLKGELGLPFGGEGVEEFELAGHRRHNSVKSRKTCSAAMSAKTAHIH